MRKENNFKKEMDQDTVNVMNKDDGINQSSPEA